MIGMELREKSAMTCQSLSALTGLQMLNLSGQGLIKNQLKCLLVSLFF
jgi:hypothetical protein